MAFGAMTLVGERGLGLNFPADPVSGEVGFCTGHDLRKNCKAQGGKVSDKS